MIDCTPWDQSWGAETPTMEWASYAQLHELISSEEDTSYRHLATVKIEGEELDAEQNVMRKL